MDAARVWIGFICAVTLISACASDETGATLLVPQNYPLIQQAVDAAQPGDLVLVDKGVYNESVTVKTNDIVIRGVDRNEVILDGEYRLTDGIRVAGANGVAVENMTARNYVVNGFYWIGTRGFRGSYLTAIRNGYYGIYAFDSRGGVFEHSYATGSYDAGFYIGQCIPCDAAITDSIAEVNGLGYSGTNASQNVVIANSIFRFNRVGIMPNSGDYEKYAPQRDAVFVGNKVYSNNNLDAPSFPQISQATGNGIVIAGGIGNLIFRNAVWDHDNAGIAIIPNILGTSFPAKGNIVRENSVSESRMADLAIAESEEATNCFDKNTFSLSMPRSIETVRPCSGSSQVGTSFFPIDEIVARTLPTSPNVSTVKDPPAQPNMPNATSRTRRIASAQPPKIDIDSITVPAVMK